jgi:hypothetical protein
VRGCARRCGRNRAIAVYELSHDFACSICGRAWSSGADEKWPIRVTATDPPRAVAHCLACAEMGAGYDARCCTADLRSQPLSIADGNGSVRVLVPRGRIVSRLRNALSATAR